MPNSAAVLASHATAPVRRSHDHSPIRPVASAAFNRSARRTTRWDSLSNRSRTTRAWANQTASAPHRTTSEMPMMWRRSKAMWFGLRRSGADRCHRCRRDLAGCGARGSTATPGSRRTGVAFGPPMSMIRHRFGGNLRAVRASILRRRPSRTALAISPATSANQRRFRGRRIGQRIHGWDVAGAPWRERRPRSFRGHPVDERSRRRD